MLGSGEQLRKLTITVEQLLDRGTRGVREYDGVSRMGQGTYIMVAFTFFPKDGDVVSPCTSMWVTVRRRRCKSSDSSEPRLFDPHRVSIKSVST